MTMNPKSEKTKKEIDPNETNKFPITSRQWSNNRNPRIVRVSRSFGGKDRHSKVCTVKGLRDRRIRLSVPTAIQLYDLQDRLGLSQPSKVVDWLLDATKNDIDKLPPLPMLPQFHEPTLLVSNTHESVSNNAQYSLSHFLSNQTYGKDKEHENQEGLGGFVAQNFFPLSNQSSFPNTPYNNFHWDPANLSLSQFGGGYSFSNQTDQDPRHESQASFLAGSSSQLYLPPFPSYITPSLENIYMRSQIYNHLQQQNSVTPTTLHLINSPLRSLVLNSRTDHSQENNNERERGKDNVNSPR